ncbi:response regulator transcription factor [Congregibacter variabilis]|uniref:Response regulator transcription factor n=1 Tax=Congregibacter variabilis TaxID=3081200 RepID=A0ABZ0I9A8_9GAMM|nr:response regulator transcription factor [Congregibacter sp. IMCC43200]
MKPLFVTSTGSARARWRAAFPDLPLSSSLDIDEAVELSLCFVDLDTLPLPDNRAAIERLITQGVLLVALSSMPSESEAFALLSLGVRGYCHAEAVPEQLQEVAEVVLAGGLWMPRELLQRISDLGKRIDAQSSERSPRHFDELTPREEEVALLVGRGYNNRELAEALGVSERTVKANLTSIFDKLGLRDRVQLALYVNRLPIH